MKKAIKVNLTKEDLHTDPFLEFAKWFEAANDSQEVMPDAMILCTVDKNQQPSIRTVLLKHYDQDGFVFFTNYNSRKSREIAENPKVAIKFYWSTLGRQLIIQGVAEKISRLQSIQYFMSRPKGSRIGAWCSNQSEVIQSRSELMSTFASLKEKFSTMEIPKPQHWGGFRIRPSTFEFWQEGEFRLHDRFRYRKVEGSEWKVDRLAP